MKYFIVCYCCFLVVCEACNNASGGDAATAKNDSATDTIGCLLEKTVMLIQ